MPDAECFLVSVPETEYARAMAHLLIQNGNGHPHEHALERDQITIGRHPENMIVLDDDSVSGRHAEIVAVDGAYTLRDLQSSNGTAVNGASAAETVLKNGDVIVFGSVECRFHDLLEKRGPEPSISEPPKAAVTPETEESPRPSFGSQLVGFGKAALGEAKRSAQMAALKAKIEKLKLIDLNKAHYALGKKVIELGPIQDRFNTERQAISDLGERIKQKRAGIAHAEQETTGEKVKRVAGETKMGAEAESLELRRKQLVTDLGRHVAEHDDCPAGLETEMAAVAGVNERITHEEEELAQMGADKEGWNQLKDTSKSLAAESGSWARSVARNQPRLLICVAAIFATVIVGLSVRHFLIQDDEYETPENRDQPGPAASASAYDIRPIPVTDYTGNLEDALEGSGYSSIVRLSRLPADLVGPLVAQSVTMDGETTRLDERIGSVGVDTIELMGETRPIRGIVTANRGRVPMTVIGTPTMIFFFADVRHERRASGARFFMGTQRIPDDARVHALIK